MDANPRTGWTEETCCTETQPPQPALQETWVLGGLGESCNIACMARDMTCESYDWGLYGATNEDREAAFNQVFDQMDEQGDNVDRSICEGGFAHPTTWPMVPYMETHNGVSRCRSAATESSLVSRPGSNCDMSRDDITRLSLCQNNPTDCQPGEEGCPATDITCEQDEELDYRGTHCCPKLDNIAENVKYQCNRDGTVITILEPFTVGAQTETEIPPNSIEPFNVGAQASCCTRWEGELYTMFDCSSCSRMSSHASSFALPGTCTRKWKCSDRLSAAYLSSIFPVERLDYANLDESDVRQLCIETPGCKGYDYPRRDGSRPLGPANAHRVPLCGNTDNPDWIQNQSWKTCTLADSELNTNIVIEVPDNVDCAGSWSACAAD